jgi:hypothetical protein
LKSGLATTSVSCNEKRRPPLGGPVRKAGFLRPVEIHDAEHPDLSDGFRRAAGAVARSVLARADLAFDLDVRALGESTRVAREFAKDHTAVHSAAGRRSPVLRSFQLRWVARARAAFSGGPPRPSAVP